MSGIRHHNTDGHLTTADLMFRYGSTVCRMVQSQSADAMEVTLLLSLHLCIINDLEKGNTESGRQVLKRLALTGGPLFLKVPYRTVFLNRAAILDKFKWTKQDYRLVRISFDRNVNKWNLLLRSFRAAKIL